MAIPSATPTTIDEYIAGFSPDIQRILQAIRETIHAAAPDAVEAIKYKIPTFVQGGNLVHFAAFTKHIGMYPSPAGTAQFQAKLSRYKAGKGSVQFPLHEPTPLELITQLVTFRTQELRAGGNAKSEPNGDKPVASQTAVSLTDGQPCVVTKGTHAGKSGTVRDINTSKTGQVTITVVQANGVRFKTLARNVDIHAVVSV